MNLTEEFAFDSLHVRFTNGQCIVAVYGFVRHNTAGQRRKKRRRSVKWVVYGQPAFLVSSYLQGRDAVEIPANQRAVRKSC